MSQNGGQGSLHGTPPSTHRVVFFALVVTGSNGRPSALGMWLRRHRERGEAKETRDPGGTPTASKHLCFSPPEPSRPGTLHIDIRLASGASPGVGGAGRHSPCDSTWPRPERSFSFSTVVWFFFFCVTVALVYRWECMRPCTQKTTRQIGWPNAFLNRQSSPNAFHSLTSCFFTNGGRLCAFS